MDRRFVSLGSALAFLAVGLGAFGTHALRDRVPASRLDVWHTAVQYHLIHAVALILVGILAEHAPSARLSGWLFLAGIVIFGGSLYVLVLTGVGVLGAITPLGGLCFLAGWAMLAFNASRRP